MQCLAGLFRCLGFPDPSQAHTANSTPTQKRQDASKKRAMVEDLACYRLPELDTSAAAIVVFGSRSEVPEHLATCLTNSVSLQDIPILVSGNGERGETGAIVDAIRYIPRIGHISVDESARSTEMNAVWTKAKLDELGLTDKPIVLFAFPVLAKSAVDALVGHGLPISSIYPAFPASALSTELFELADDDDRAIKEGWLTAKLNQAKRSEWAGKP